jgi:Flp pilus assembly protein TadD
LQQAEALNPNDPELHHVRALAFLNRREISTALASITRAHELAPQDSAISTTLGKILMDAGKRLEAEKVLIQPANDALYRESYRARTNLAILYQQRGDLAAAREQLDRAVNEAPRDACHAYYFRSQMELKEGQLREALKDLEHATTQVCGPFAEAHLAVGVALTRSHRYDLARKKFVEVSQRFKGSESAEKALENLRYLP